MTRNTLYNFIEFKRKQLESALPQGISSLIKDTTVQEKKYYRFELNKEDFSFILGDLQLTLVEHHLSIYQDQDHRHSEKSQYHYTGKLVDGAGQLYILHSHFNDEDELTKEPTLEKRGHETSERISTKPVKHLLSHFSRIKTDKLICFLKEEMNKEIDFLIKQSELCETEACKLFCDFEKNSEAYWNKLDQLCSFYNELTILVSHSYYEKRVGLINAMKTQLLSKANVVSKSQDEFSSSSEGDEVIESTAKPTLVIVPEPITKDLKVVQNLFHRFSTHEKSEIFAVEFVESHSKVSELIVLLECKSHSASFEEMNELLKLQRDIYKKIEQIFPLLLLNNNFESVKKNIIFHQFIAVKHLNLALNSRNKNFLDCILSIKGTELLNQTVTVKGIKYANALSFCFEQTDPDEKLADCFEVLINNKASLMTADTKGCPIAYSLFCHPHNPLTIRMNRFKEKPYFWKNLISALNLYLSSAKGLNEQEYRKIKQDIEIYQINKDLIKSNYGFFKQQMRIFGPLNEKSLDVVQKDFVAKLEEDSVIKYQIERASLLLQSYFEVLPAQERQKIKKNANLTSKEFVEATLSKELHFQNYQELRANTLNILEETISSLELKINAQRLHNGFKTPRKFNRKTKGDMREYTQLQEKMNQNPLLEKLFPTESDNREQADIQAIDLCKNSLRVNDLIRSIKPLLDRKNEQKSLQKIQESLAEIARGIERVKELKVMLSTAKLEPFSAKTVQASYEMTLRDEKMALLITDFLKNPEEEENSANLAP